MTIYQFESGQNLLGHIVYIKNWACLKHLSMLKTNFESADGLGISLQVVNNCSAFGSTYFCVSFSRERKSERIERKFKTQNPNCSLAWTILLEKRPYIWPSFTRLQSRSYWAYYKTQCGPESMFKFKNSKGRNKIFLGYVVYLNPLLRWLFLKHKPFIFRNFWEV